MCMNLHIKQRKNPNSDNRIAILGPRKSDRAMSYDSTFTRFLLCLASGLNNNQRGDRGRQGEALVVSMVEPQLVIHWVSQLQAWMAALVFLHRHSLSIVVLSHRQTSGLVRKRGLFWFMKFQLFSQTSRMELVYFLCPYSPILSTTNPFHGMLRMEYILHAMGGDQMASKR